MISSFPFFQFYHIKEFGCVTLFLTQQETIDPRRQMTMGNQVIDARGRKFTKRVVDIRELNEQAKVIDDLK